MVEKMIHFDNAREAQDVTARGSKMLLEIGDRFGVQITARDTWLRLEGDADQVDTANRFFEGLREARNQGTEIQEQGILFAMEAFARGQEESLRKLYSFRIDVCNSMRPVFPRTFGQQAYCEAMRTQDIVFGLGPAGTGKTYLAMAMAVSSLLKEEVSRIILTRPAIEAGETLGFLPGDMHEKVYPYLRPLYDALYDMMSPQDIDRNTARGIIEIAPLAYMRGRTLNNAFVILDEAQNTTPEQMLMLLTRLGFDSKCVVTGDASQVDLSPDKISGLLEAKETLQGIEGIAFSTLTDEDVVRHALVQKIIKAYRTGRGNKDSSNQATS